MKQPLDCVWAKHGLALHNSGRGYLCCHSRKYLQDDNGNDLYWSTNTLTDAWNSPTRQEIITALENGERHWNCQACWDEEDAGRESRRTWNNKLFTDLDSSNGPKLMDLKLGNTCNLSCRMCWPEISSKWYDDYFEVFEHTQTKDEYKLRWKTIQQSYTEHNTRLWDDLKEYLRNVKHIDIYGAEPMLLKKLWEILGWIRNEGLSKHKTIHINTNGTIWNPNYIDILKSFKKVNLDLSIDALGPQYEYIRNGDTWDNITKNIEQFKQLNQNSTVIDICVCITVTNFNIYYLDETWEYFVKHGINPFINFVHMPEHQCVRIMPDAIKKQIADKLIKNKNESWQKQVDLIINFMNMPIHNQHTHWNEFLRATHELDILRNQSFEKTFEEFYKLCQLTD